MFTGEMKEKEQEVISLNGISAIGMQELLDFAYTSTLALTSGKIFNKDVKGIITGKSDDRPSSVALNRYM